TRYRGAVEGGVECLFVEFEPAAQRAAGAAPPGCTFLPLDDPRRLAVEIGLSARDSVHDRPGLDLIAGVEAEAAACKVTLERGDRSMPHGSFGSQINGLHGA